ncbi:MAG: CPBP family intramembrane metalloprotease, partial [Firmicutes bacterium]|nr:CPBP family intramembrane metalloprotease [Bacillota bacterium]
MDKIYRKNGILFAIIWIVVYVVGLSIADNLSITLGIEKSISLLVCVAMTTISYYWIKKNGYMKRFGLCRPVVSSKE